MMDKKPPPPTYFRTKKWILVITSMLGVWLFYQYSEKMIDIFDSKEFQYDIGHELTDETMEAARAEMRSIKRWCKISFVLLSGAGIFAQISGVIGGMRGYLFMVNAHVFINLFVVAAHIFLFVCTYLFSSFTIKRTYTFELSIKIGGLTFLALNIGVGYLFLRDLNLIHYREKLSRCTCSYIAAAQAQFAAQQAREQQQHQQMQQPGSQQYITGPDGSRYMIARPQPIGGRSGNGNGDGNGNQDGSDWPIVANNIGPGVGLWP